MGNAKSKSEARTVELETFFSENFPKYLLEGPYKNLTKFTLLGMVVSILTLRHYINSNQEYQVNNIPIGVSSVIDDPEILKQVKLSGAIFGLSVLALMLKTVGYFPLVSYTMLSWNLTTFRFLFGYLALAYNSKTFKGFEEAMRFPSLVQNSITFIVWWFVLVPVISTFLYLKAKKARDSSLRELKAFLVWNFSPFLMTVHGINLPFAFLGHLIQPRELHVGDLYYSFVSALVYLTFYLAVLDRMKLPLYIILSPRSYAGPASYLAIMGLYVYIWAKLNTITPFLAALIQSFITGKGSA